MNLNHIFKEYSGSLERQDLSVEVGTLGVSDMSYIENTVWRKHGLETLAPAHVRDSDSWKKGSRVVG